MSARDHSITEVLLMDLNYLFHRQQVERSKASSADSEAARKAHEELASMYEDEIKRASDGKVKFPVHGKKPKAALKR